MTNAASNDAWIWNGHRGGKGLAVCICCQAMKSAGHYGDCELAALLVADRRTIWAYILDRAGQYAPSSGIVVALENVAVNILRGEADLARAHGELDDILARLPGAIAECRASGSQTPETR